MTDEQLRDALMEAQDYMLNQLPTMEWHYQFSPKFHKKMKKLIEMEKHPIWYYVRWVAPVLLILFGIFGGLALGARQEVRAGVVGWFVEHFTDNKYRYQNNMDAGTGFDVSQYTLEGNAPEGYQLLDRMEDENQVTEVYVGANGEMLFFSAMNSSCEEELYVSSDQNMRLETVYLGGMEAELYATDNPGDSSTIIWQGTNGVLFSIKGILEREQLIHMAEKIE